MIFEHTSSNSYLRDYIKRLPKRGFGEAKKMAEHLGVSSTYMSQVLSGAKILTLEQAMSLNTYLGLNPTEAEYLFSLVQFERAGTSDLKKYFSGKLEDLKKNSLKLVKRVDAKRLLTEQEKSVFYSNSLYSSIHIYCATHKNGRNLEEIAQRFEIPRAKAAEVMRFLLEANLCKEQNGQYSTGNQGTHLEHGSPHLLKHYTNWRLRAIQAAEDLEDDELMYTINVALSAKDFASLREQMVVFIKSFLEQAYPSPSEEIACLNLDWFRIRK